MTSDARRFALRLGNRSRHEEQLRNNTMMVSRSPKQEAVLQELTKHSPSKSSFEASVATLEAGLRDKPIRKNYNLMELQANIRHKALVRQTTRPFYERHGVRKGTFSAYIRQQIFVHKAMTDFKTQMGPPGKALVCMGDYAARDSGSIRGLARSPVSGTVDWFRRAGYTVQFIQEYHTSKKCSKCKKPGLTEGICKTFKEVADPRPWKFGQTRICHGLVMCTTCRTLFDRDHNATCNQAEIALALRNGEPRPEHLGYSHPEINT